MTIEPVAVVETVSTPVAAVRSPKLTRPRSLSIQQRPDELLTNGSKAEAGGGGVKSKTEPEPEEVEEVIIVEKIVEDVANSNVMAEDEVDGNGQEMGRKTPSNLTAQGYVDLKFYHSRLW